MAHFAEVNIEDNEVIRVVVIDDDEFSSEETGIARCLEIWPDTGTSIWVQTFKYTDERKLFAGPGTFWDATNDGFRMPQPYPSWTYDTTACTWEAPTQAPSTTTRLGEGENAVEYIDYYDWNEATAEWIKMPNLPQ